MIRYISLVPAVKLRAWRWAWFYMRHVFDKRKKCYRCYMAKTKLKKFIETRAFRLEDFRQNLVRQTRNSILPWNESYFYLASLVFFKNVTYTCPDLSQYPIIKSICCLQLFCDITNKICCLSFKSQNGLIRLILKCYVYFTVNDSYPLHKR